MARLIDADKFEVYTCVNKSSDYVDGVQSMLEAIDSAPTVDAVEIVRCQYCKYYEIHKPKVLENCERNGYLIPMKPNDFCSYGDQKDSDGNG